MNCPFCQAKISYITGFKIGKKTCPGCGREIKTKILWLKLIGLALGVGLAANVIVQVVFPSSLQWLSNWLSIIGIALIFPLSVKIIEGAHSKEQISGSKPPQTAKMSVNRAILEYIKQAKSSGMSQAEMQKELLKAGWKEKEIQSAFTQKEISAKEKQAAFFKKPIAKYITSFILGGSFLILAILVSLWVKNGEFDTTLFTVPALFVMSLGWAIKSKMYKWLPGKIIVGLFLLLTILIVLAIFTYKGEEGGDDKEKEGEKASQKTSQENSVPSASSEEDLMNHPNIVRYSVDTDGDMIPDFVEVERGLDPNVTVADECKREACGDPELSELEKKDTNVLVILDASGSMAQSVGGTTKMQAAKDALNQFIDKQEVKDNFNIGLMVYGHKGSNSVADKAYSCSQIEVFYPLSPLNKTQFKNVVVNINATGWTPIEGALNLASTVFAGKEGENNHIILISDGIEQCDGNPVAAAKRIKASEFKLTVNIIGFNIASSDQQQLKTIAESTGGNFVNTTSSGEILREMSRRTSNIWGAVNYRTCRIWSNVNYSTCLLNTYVKTGNWLIGAQGPVGIWDNDEIALKEKEVIREVYKRMSDERNRLYEEARGVLEDQFAEDNTKIKETVEDK